MRKYLTLAIAVMLIKGTGCIKPSTTSAPTVNTVPPDVTGFTISTPSAYKLNTGIPVSITAPKLLDGSYVLSYSLSGQSYGGSSYNANVTFTGGKGSFTTPTIQYGGCQTLTTNSIQRTAGLTSSPVIASAGFCDSSGVMDAMYNNTKFYSTHVGAILNGSGLQITGTVYDGSSYYSQGKTIQLSMQNFTQSPKTVSFTQADYYDKGYASYQSSTNNQNAAYGKISITATSPILMGNFSFTAMDSSKFSGTFSVTAP